MKFCLVVPEEFAIHFRRHSFEISGLLNWAPVLGGDVRMINEDLSPYDTIMTNVSSTESEYISILRQLNPDVKIIACFDYGFDIINQYFSNLHRIKQVMNRVDYIFSVNLNQAKWMRILFPDKEIHHIPHPTDIDNVRKFAKPLEDRERELAVMWHQYDNYQIQSLEVVKVVERKLKRPVEKTLVGLKSRIMIDRGISVPAASMPYVADDYPDIEARGKLLDPDLDKIVQMTPPGVAWDAVLPYMGVEMWYQSLSNFRMALDLYTVNSIGRFGIDCAGVQVPCVASDRQDSSKMLWPFTTINPFEPDGAIAFVSKLLSNQEFYSKTLRTASKNLEKFGFAKSKERMMRVLDG